MLDLLASDGKIFPSGEDDLDALVSRVRRSSVLPNSAYKRALADFVDVQWLFVRDLLCLINALKKLAPLLGDGHSHTLGVLLSAYANLEIELLLTVEKMLQAPPHRHLWAVAVRRWSIAVEIYSGLMIVEEQEVKRALLVLFEAQKGVSTVSLQNDQATQENLKLVTSCLELLSRPSQMIPQTTQFFQHILSILLGEPLGIEPISSVQREDILEGQRLVKDTLNVVKGTFKETGTDQPLENLVPHVKNWDNTEIEEFGRFIQAGNLSITTYDSRATATNVSLHLRLLSPR